MVYELKDCRTGARETKRKTTVEISVKDGIADFVFTAVNFIALTENTTPFTPTGTRVRCSSAPIRTVRSTMR